MALLMARTSQPPGLRFHPTDVELIMYYLKRKIMGWKLHYDVIAELNIYKFSPWDLPDKSLIRSKDLEWYFFSPRERKYASGVRTKRATENGFWKSTGKDRPVLHKNRTVGMIKTLVFHTGHPSKGKRTDWVMHEYRLEDKNLDAYVLCKVFQKTGPGPQNGAQYGAPFIEEDWSDGEEICAEPSAVDGQSPSVLVPPCYQDVTTVVGLTVPGSTSGSVSEPGPSTAWPSATELPPDVVDHPVDDIDALLAMFADDSTLLNTENNTNEKPETVNSGKSVVAVPCAGGNGNGNDIYSSLGDLVELNGARFNFSSGQEAGVTPNSMHLGHDPAFLELNDLTYPADTNDSKQAPSGSPYATFSGNVNSQEGFYCQGDYPNTFPNAYSPSNYSYPFPQI